MLKPYRPWAGRDLLRRGAAEEGHDSWARSLKDPLRGSQCQRCGHVASFSGCQSHITAEMWREWKRKEQYVVQRQWRGWQGGQSGSQWGPEIQPSDFKWRLGCDQQERTAGVHEAMWKVTLVANNCCRKASRELTQRNYGNFLRVSADQRASGSQEVERTETMMVTNVLCFP